MVAIALRRYGRMLIFACHVDGIAVWLVEFEFEVKLRCHAFWR